MLVFAAGCLELLGGVLFTLNLKVGAFLLVRRHTAHSTQHSAAMAASGLEGQMCWPTGYNALAARNYRLASLCSMSHLQLV